MLKEVVSKNFEAEPCYFEDKFRFARKHEEFYSLMFIQKDEITELIQLLKDAKEQFEF